MSLAQRILDNAHKKGISVEEYLHKIAKDETSNGAAHNGSFRRSASYVDASLSRVWLETHAHEHVGKWVVLDGGNLIGSGDDPVKIVAEARRSGVLVPFVKFIPFKKGPFAGMWL